MLKLNCSCTVKRLQGKFKNATREKGKKARRGPMCREKS
jgi:hypothetical protein